jgi:hypothetical protein
MPARTQARKGEGHACPLTGDRGTLTGSIEALAWRNKTQRRDREVIVSESVIDSESGVIFSRITGEPGVEYRLIPGFPGYAVGSDGSVWSCWIPRNPKMGECWRRRKVHRNRSGHLRVSLRGKKAILVHRLILLAFVGTCPEGMEACHNGGNTTNNRLDNLRWDTRQANAADALRHGTQVVGSRAGMARGVAAVSGNRPPRYRPRGRRAWVTRKEKHHVT